MQPIMPDTPDALLALTITEPLVHGAGGTVLLRVQPFYLMSSPTTGTHTLAIAQTDAARLWTHWEGFQEKQADDRPKTYTPLQNLDAFTPDLTARITELVAQDNERDEAVSALDVLASHLEIPAERIDREKLAEYVEERLTQHNLQHYRDLEIVGPGQFTVRATIEVQVSFEVEAIDADEAEAEADSLLRNLEVDQYGIKGVRDLVVDDFDVEFQEAVEE